MSTETDPFDNLASALRGMQITNTSPASKSDLQNLYDTITTLHNLRDWLIDHVREIMVSMTEVRLVHIQEMVQDTKRLRRDATKANNNELASVLEQLERMLKVWRDMLQGFRQFSAAEAKLKVMISEMEESEDDGVEDDDDMDEDEEDAPDKSNMVKANKNLLGGEMQDGDNGMVNIRKENVENTIIKWDDDKGNESGKDKVNKKNESMMIATNSVTVNAFDSK